MPPKAKAVIPPVKDPSLDETFLGVDREDPRYLGEGPCGKDHPIVSAEFNPRTWDLLWGGNEYCRYAVCKDCALRLGYWGKHGAPMTYVKQDKPKHVRMALQMLESESDIPLNCPKLPGHRLMISLIAHAVLQDKIESSKRPVQRNGRRPKSSPAASRTDRSEWVELSPRVSPEKMAQTEKLLRQSEERENALAERLATLERQLGMAAPVPPSPTSPTGEKLPVL